MVGRRVILRIGVVAWLALAPGHGRGQEAASDAVVADRPPPASLLTRIAFGSCADQRRPQPIWNAIAATNPDLFLFLGDNVYGTQYGTTTGLAGIDRAYREFAGVPAFDRFRRQVPVLAIWDDHDYGLNDAGVELPFKSQSKDRLLDFFDVPADAPVRGHAGVYQAATFGPEGRRLQIILLDTRWSRSPLKRTDQRGAPGKERYVPDPNPRKTMLGPIQWAWLEKQFRQPADLRLLVSSIQVVADGHGYERWGNLPAERRKLYDLIRRTGTDGVVVLSGDRHLGALYRLGGDVVGYPLYEITSSALNRGRDADPDEFGPHQLFPAYGPNNFGLVTVNWHRKVLSLELMAEDGDRVRGLTVPFGDLRAQ